MVNYAPLLNAPDIGQSFLQGQQQGRELRMQGQRDNALRALSTNPQDIGAINALMAVDPRTALAFEERGARQAQQAQADQRNAALGSELAQMPGLPEGAQRLAAGGDPEGALQIMQLYSQADASRRAQMKEQFTFLANSSQSLLSVTDPQQRLALGRQLAQQGGFDPNMVTPESVTDAALNAAVGQAIGIKGQLDMLDKRLGREIQMRGQDIQIRGQDMAAATAAANRAVSIRGQDMARGNAMVASMPKPPAGYRWKGDGSLEPIPGGPAGNGKPLTGEQAKSAGQLALALQAEQTLGRFTGIPSEAAVAAYGTPVIERSVDAPTRRVLGAQMAFTEAALRFSTGAAYTKEEIKNNIAIYFPRPGDTPEAVRDKAALRQQMIQAMKLGAGPAANRVTTTPTGGRAPSAPKVGTVKSGYRFKGGNPASPSSWEKVN